MGGHRITQFCAHGCLTELKKKEKKLQADSWPQNNTILCPLLSDRAAKETLQADVLDQGYLLHVMEWSVGEVRVKTDRRREQQ